MSILAVAQVILTGNNAQLVASLDEAQKAMANAGRQMTRLGTELTVLATAPIVAMGVASAKSASEFDAAMRKVAALTDTSALQVKAWSGEVRSLAMEYGVVGKEAADALYFIASAGVPASDTMEALTTSLKGAVVGLGDAKTVAMMAVSAMNAYTKSALTATRATEILAAGVKFGQFEAAQLAPELGTLTGQAAAMGISLENMVGTLAVFSRTGTNAAEASTQLSSVFTVLLGNSESATRSLAEHGLSLAMLRETAAGPQGLINVFRQMSKAYDGSDIALRQVIPSVRAFRGVMNALAQDQNVVNHIMADVTNSVGFLDKAFLLSKGSAFEMNQALSTMKDASISLGNALLPVLVPVMHDLADIAKTASERINNLSTETKGVLFTFAGLLAALGPIVLAFGTLRWALGGLPILTLLAPATALTGAFKVLGADILATAGYLRSQWVFAAWRANNAGTGLAGTLLNLRPAAAAAGVAIAGLAANMVVIGGIGLIVYKLAQMNAVINETAKVLKDAEDHMKALFLFVGTTPEQARKEIAKLNAEFANLYKGGLASDKAIGRERIAMEAAVSKAEKAGQLMGEFGASIEESIRAPYQARIDALEERVKSDLRMVLEGKQAIAGLQKIVDADDKAKAAAATAAANAPGVWMDEAKKALDKLNADLFTNVQKQREVGDEFNKSKADASAYEEAIRKISEAHAPLNAQLDKSGTTLNKLVDRMGVAGRASYEFADSQEAMAKVFREAKEMVTNVMSPLETYRQNVAKLVYTMIMGNMTWAEMNVGIKNQKDILDDSNEAYRTAKSLLEESMTPQQKYQQGVDALNLALKDGVIKTLAEYNQALAYLKRSTDGSIEKTKLLEHALYDVARHGIDTLIDSLFDGKKTFSDFVQSALKDIAKLLIKMELLKLFSNGGKNDSFLKNILGFAEGGFLPGNNFGIVGENGPELVMAGNRGMTIMPLTGEGGQRSGDNFNISVPLNVTAVDAKGVAQFFEENGGMVAGAVLKAVQRSTAMRRQLGG